VSVGVKVRRTWEIFAGKVSPDLGMSWILMLADEAPGADAAEIERYFKTCQVEIVSRLWPALRIRRRPV